MNLTQQFPFTYGWDTHWQKIWDLTDYQHSGWVPVRMTADFGQQFKVATDKGECIAEYSGKLRHAIEAGAEIPAVGDWLAAELFPGESKARIHGVLPRRSKISRKAAGTPVREQIIATNIDILFIVTSLNLDLNLRRLERYLIMAWNSGTQPVIVLSKADLCDPDFRLQALNDVSLIAPGIPVHIVSAQTGEGIDELAHYFSDFRSCALTGTSGCGKSTLTNALIGKEVQRTSDIREDDSRGRHTTTHRQMFEMPHGGILIDTPGMRELQLWDGEEDGIKGTFSEIDTLAQHCKFRDCTHHQEEGCAVKEAIDQGELLEERLNSYRKTQREQKFLERKEKSRSFTERQGGSHRQNQKKQRRDKSWLNEE
ncbi:ribosome small subunit-dependent GTPase A [Saccharibacillus sp. JS10]|uniref:ribosome small subunit-dependent GTPase A n=1 Tax=Saccharibacillus sp. JS10 TaxID=2950552 RepID=UPI00210A7E67|nr:ribosome small subunit-dependent GTPase A [Saccharibacillus sp. JS10]MCQ4087281.1 ribosome small subunit-dependent GTPase A [Saccharibacillus sp. JS10]